MSAYNRHLARQLKKHLGADFDPPEEWKHFLDAVNNSYDQYEDDRKLLERAMDISSEELFESNQRLRQEKQQQELLLKSLKESLQLLQLDSNLPFSKEIIDNDLLNLADWLRLEINQRQEAESSLTASQSNLSALVENTEDSIFSLDSEMRVTTYNSVAFNQFQWIYKNTPELGKHINEILPEEGYRYWESIYGRALQGERFTLEHSFSQSGQMYFFETSFNPIREKDVVTGITVFGKDITERKEIENKRKKLYNDLKVANKELREFAYITSHDLKSPLRAIGSLVNWIEEDYKDLFDETGKQQLVLLQNRTKRMYAFIDGMLAYTKLSQVQDRMEYSNLNELLKGVIDLALPLDGTVQICVEDVLPNLSCQPIKVAQIFQNILSNAVEYCDNGKGIIKVHCEELETHWLFSISDNGPGIAPNHHNRIFKIFQTLNTRDSNENTGIGLTIAKKIVELHNGKIWVESVLGDGATFHFTLAK